VSHQDIEDHTADEADVVVVVNDEQQYSIWPSDREPPAGWHTVGVQGSKQHCLDHIGATWTDLRPLGLRERMRR